MPLVPAYVQVMPSSESLTFSLERKGLPVPSYSFILGMDGSATYRVAYPPEVAKYSPYAATAVAAPPTNMTMQVKLSPATTAMLFEKVRGTDGFRKPCASKAKNIADTGVKTLTYVSAGGTATCTYNYTEEKAILALTTSFQSIALTLDEGRKLEAKHRFDRLALDPESDYLVKAVKAGNATELGTIAPVLQSLVDDPQVLERVRQRAAELLAQAAVVGKD